jgi:hypothetical protein
MVMPMMVAMVMMAVVYFHHYLGLRRNRRGEAEDKYQCKEELFHSRNTSVG